MDDTVAMQDTNGPTMNGLSSSDMYSAIKLQQQQQQLGQQPAGLGIDNNNNNNNNRADLSPKAPQSPSALAQQVNCDASSVASDGSQDQPGSTSSSTRQHGPPRRTYSSVDVDTAKQAAMSALAGLDMSTTKANLDASKAAAATARANGEVPTHVRKSNLRSVSCRQLGSSGTTTATTTTATAATGGVGKSVAFDETAKQRPPDGARTVQWRAGTNTTDGSQPRRTTRAPASRCISLPQVLHGRAGMANRLAATYAQEAALTQQLQLLNGTQAAHPFTTGVHQLQSGVPSMDVLSMYQLQQQAAAAGAANGQLLSQRSFGANVAGAATMDDSMLQLRSNNMLLAAQQQQQQQQAARMGGNWQNAAAPPHSQQQRVTWAPGPAHVPQQALSNPQLLVHLQGGTTQGVSGAAGTPPGSDTLWLQNPGGASGALMSSNRPQSLLMANQPGGMPGLAASSGLISPHMQTSGGLAAGTNPGAALMSTFNPLLDQYQAVSWSVLAAAQADSNIREQLLTEVVLQLTLLHTLNGVLKSSLGPSEALSDLSYLGSAARRHIATFSRLSQAGDIAVQLLAMIAPLACRHLTTTDVMESTFLVLDTLALANRDVSAVVGQQRMNALSSLLLQLPMDQLLQQQTLGLAWINNMTSAVNRSKQLLESMAAGPDQSQAGQAVPAGQANLLQAAGGNAAAGMPLAGMPMSSQPLLVSPTGHTLSPSGKTPLATYFEESQHSSLVSPSAAAAGGAGSGSSGTLAGVPGLSGPVPADTMLQDSLAGFNLAGQGGGADETAAGLAGMSLGVAPGLAAPTAGGAAGQRSFSPLAAGLPLFGDSTLLVPSSTAGASAPNSTGAPAGLVGV